MRAGCEGIVIAAVVLAAGASTRLGQPKQLTMLGGETLLERAVRTAQEAGLSPVIVVVQDATLIETLQARGAQVLLNRKFYEGMSTSIHAGVRWAVGMKADGVVLMTCDQPGLTAGHLRELCTEPEMMAGSGYEGKIGIPAYFPSSRFGELMKLSGDVGARELLRGARSVSSEALALDIDTQDDLQRARELFG
jgi:CTP:molybdopterin cytidylyltransferase MocA